MMSTTMMFTVVMVLTVVMTTTADPIVPYVAPSDAVQLTEFKFKQLEQVLENVLKQNAELKTEMDKQKASTMLTDKQNAELKIEMEKQKASIKNLTESVRNQTPGGAVYIRWGRTVCEGDAVVVYRGFAGGTHYNFPAGASNTHCLSSSPDWGTYVDGNQASSDIWGVEYELDSTSGSPFDTRNNGGLTLKGQDAPCVLCHTATRQTQVMIPGKKSCPTGWVLEYWGYLVDGGSRQSYHYRTESICLDEAPETSSGGSADQDGVRWYPVQAQCGSLPCTPYVAGRELTCVVCSLSAPA